MIKLIPLLILLSCNPKITSRYAVINKIDTIPGEYKITSTLENGKILCSLQSVIDFNVGDTVLIKKIRMPDRNEVRLRNSIISPMSGKR